MFRYLCAVAGLIAGLQMLTCHPAVAGVMAERTRLIFEQGRQERSIMLANTNTYPVIVQTWMDNGEGNSIPDTTVSGMISLPAVFRMQANETRSVRVIYTNDPLPADRESVFWLNLHEIPLLPVKEASGQASVLVGVNTQMKVFYRPKDLPSSPGAIGEMLDFRLQKTAHGWELICHNRSPYHASFSALDIAVGEQRIAVDQEADMMTPPLSERHYGLAQVKSDVDGKIKVHYTLIDDQGNYWEGNDFASP